MEQCATCGKEGSVFRSRSGKRICILCVQNELYGRNDWDASSSKLSQDSISAVLERLQQDPIENLISRRRAEFSKLQKS